MNISVALQRTKAASELDVQTSESPIFIKVLIFEFGSRSWLKFGSFVEKNLPPFTSSIPEFNCAPENPNCAPPYSFYHRQKLADITAEQFSKVGH